MNEFVFNPEYPNEITGKRSEIGKIISKPLDMAPLLVANESPEPLPELSAEEIERYNDELRLSICRSLTRLSISVHKQFDRLEADSLGR